ncbi:flagellin [Natronincola peptidivorans]|uniref:Flagellin n=1 Tax=Natronincola peptidivorans TaxID=426128 RepID=A0A1H9ZWQ5_9FIRM|nr:flagellin [Natronincola peptidivorans]SES86206.1 flagellin [Natronincola peptidivorans]
MRINHNIPALNAHRLLNVNNGNSAKVLERLSSGKRINKAADDAAGMAISEKMKAQVRGLRKASQNTLDGISLIQTAEGAMNEVHSMLQRMRELAVQAANGTTTDEDRKSIQDEINQLTSEVNRIANGTEFNTRKILQGNDGPNSNTTVHKMSTGTSAQILGVAFANDAAVSGLGSLTSESLSIWIDGEERVVNLNKLDGTTNNSTKDNLLEALNNAMGNLGKAIFTDGDILEIKANSIGGTSELIITGTDRILGKLFDATYVEPGPTDPAYVFSGDLTVRGEAEKDLGNAVGSFYFNKMPEIGSTLTIGKEKVEFYDSSVGPYTGSNRPINIHNKSIEDIVKEISNLGFDGVKMQVDSGVSTRLLVEANAPGFTGQAIFLEGTPEEFVTNLQIGPNQGQGFRLVIGDIRAKELGISSTTPDGNTGVKGAAFRNVIEVTDGLSEGTIEYALDLSTEARATAAITVYDNAIVKLAGIRGSLGATQNRLEYTAANLDNTTENLTAALSRIEDADMALEMSEFTKLNILTQSGVAMLAQANQRPQSILQLLGS